MIDVVFVTDVFIRVLRSVASADGAAEDAGKNIPATKICLGGWCDILLDILR